MSDQFLDFDVNSQILAIIKQHRANTATMAREIVTLRAKNAGLRKAIEQTLDKEDMPYSSAETLRKAMEES